MIAAKAKPRRTDGASRAVTAEYLDAHQQLYQRPRVGVQGLLSRLEGVRETGAGQWIAKCPAHEDRSPSLSIRECPDSTILLHDFAGCEAGAVLGAVGLGLKDLFPEPLPGSRYESLPPKRRPFAAADALKALAHELTVAAFIASDAAAGKRLVTGADADRLAEIAGRVGAAVGCCS